LLAKADSLLTLPADQLQAKIDKYLSKVEGSELETDDADKPERNFSGAVHRPILDILLSESRPGPNLSSLSLINGLETGQPA
jgi:hypothetical protein